MFFSENLNIKLSELEVTILKVSITGMKFTVPVRIWLVPSNTIWSGNNTNPVTPNR
jgi:hypothetical protein